MKNHKKNNSGFAIIIVVIAVLVIMTIVVGAAIYVVQKNNKMPEKVDPSAIISNPGSSYSVEELTLVDGQDERVVDNSSDSQVQTKAKSADSAASDMGSSYDNSEF